MSCCPSLAIGGFDGSHTQIGDYTDPIVDLDQDNPADLSLAPEGPFLKEQMGAEKNPIIGLGNDEPRLHHSGVQLHRR